MNHEMSAEHELIAKLFQPIAGEGSLSLLDDAAFLTPPAGHDLVITADAVVSGVHFLPGDAPADIARKALRVNLSDLAAKGAEPIGFLHVLALPSNGFDERWLIPYARGLGEDAKSYRCPLLGGDIVSTPGPLTVSITAFGTVPSGRMVRRATARVGDAIVCTGTIGDAVLGLKLLRDPEVIWGKILNILQHEHLISRYHQPQPRSALAGTVRTYCSAAMDVSDGFVGDLCKLLVASEVGAVIDVADVPLSSAAAEAVAADGTLLEAVLTGGDDYEIVATVPPDKLAAFLAAAGDHGVHACRVGEVCAPEKKILFRNRDGSPMVFARPAYSHL